MQINTHKHTHTFNILPYLPKSSTISPFTDFSPTLFNLTSLAYTPHPCPNCPCSCMQLCGQWGQQAAIMTQRPALNSGCRGRAQRVHFSQRLRALWLEYRCTSERPNCFCVRLYINMELPEQSNHYVSRVGGRGGSERSEPQRLVPLEGAWPCLPVAVLPRCAKLAELSDASAVPRCVLWDELTDGLVVLTVPMQYWITTEEKWNGENARFISK